MKTSSIIRIVLAGIVHLLSCISVLWFGLLAITTPYGEDGRVGYIAGLTLSLIIAIIAAGLIWKKEEK